MLCMKRNRSLLKGAALGAAGAALAYGWWSLSSQDGEGPVSLTDAVYSCASAVAGKASQQLSWLLSYRTEDAAALEAEAADAGQGPSAEFDENIQRYFDSVQQITDTQTLPDWVQRLYDRLVMWTDFDSVKVQLKALQADSSPEATQRKVALWQQLAVLSFTRTLSACWLIPLLDLLLRIRLNILGRHLYLESTLENLQPARQWRLQLPGSGKQRSRGLPPKLSNRAQEMYLNSSSFFPEVGAKLLVDQMAEAVTQAISGIPLKAQLQPLELVQLTSSIHLLLDRQFSGTEWVSVLAGPDLPTPTTHAAPDGSVTTVHPLEAAMVDEMNTEVRQVLGSSQFEATLLHAVKHAAREAAEGMAAKFEAVGGGVGGGVAAAAVAGVPGVAGARLPFPKVVGIVAASSDAIFDPMGRIRKGIANLPAVQSLCATVYACGPIVEPRPAPLAAHQQRQQQVAA